jgi:hypothetical protein
VKPLHLELDQHVYDRLLAVRHAIVERNKERAVGGLHTAFEKASFKDIVSRGIDLVAAEVIASITSSDVI